MILTKKLSPVQFEKARSFLKTHARKLERAMFEYEFESGSSDAVLDAIKEYQNEDGGFGKAIEPDCRSNAPSPVGTTVALQYISQLNVGESHPLVKQATQYFLDTFHEEKMGWEFAPIELQDAPRAPWWDYQELTADKIKWANPGAEIVGYLHQFKGLVDPGFLTRITEFAIDCLNLHPDQMEMHDLLCYLRMADRLSEKDQERVFKKLDRAVRSTVATNPNEWNRYCLLPLQVVDSPGSRFAAAFDQKLIQQNLDFIIDTQTEDGSWQPAWSWGRFEEEWKDCRKRMEGYFNSKSFASTSFIQLPVVLSQ